MKKLSIIIVLVALFCVILTAVSCGKSATTTAKTPAATTPAATTPAKVTTTAPVVTTTTPVTTTVPVTTTAILSTGKPDPVVTPVEKILNPKTAFEAKVFDASNGLDLPYRIYVPADYSEEYAYPVVLVLHGAGERGTDNTNQLNNLIPNLFSKKNSPFYQAIVICPQCPSGSQWVNTPWANGNYSVDRTPISKPLQAAVELLDSVIENYSINTNRQYVTGLSMGGFGTWDLLMRYPERFAAAIPYCGGADTTKAASLVNVPIHTFHDTSDPTVPCAGTQAMVEAIKAAGGTLIEYTETKTYGHDVWSPGSRSLALLNWLFDQRKG
ncbi:MAG: prolyl oligopeptidase family serine peptidase [Clostridia bacterium]|nr:prolyl oligopeptidase family serine peptidase [Clostridia bacterium]